MPIFQSILQPFGYTKSGDKQDKANNKKQEKQKFRNSRCRRGNTGKTKDRRDQRNYQKYNRPAQHNNPPFFCVFGCPHDFARLSVVAAAVAGGRTTRASVLLPAAATNHLAL
jgi:hypothetical protein